MSVTVLHLVAGPRGDHILASTDADAVVILSWDPAARRLRLVGHLHGTQNDHHAFPRALWGPKGRYVYATGKDWTIVVWDLVGGRVVRRLKHHRRAVRDLAATAEPYCLVAVSYDRTASIWGPAVVDGVGPVAAPRPMP